MVVKKEKYFASPQTHLFIGACKYQFLTLCCSVQTWPFPKSCDQDLIDSLCSFS